MDSTKIGRSDNVRHDVKHALRRRMYVVASPPPYVFSHESIIHKLLQAITFGISFLQQYYVIQTIIQCCCYK